MKFLIDQFILVVKEDFLCNPCYLLVTYHLVTYHLVNCDQAPIFTLWKLLFYLVRL